jgi:hypothetical protein
MLLTIAAAIPASGTGFTDLATCYKACKGDSYITTNLGECRLHFYSSFGGGTQIHMILSGGQRIDGQFPGKSTNYGFADYLVNGLPGIVKTVCTDCPAYCVRRLADNDAYCELPLNHR